MSATASPSAAGDGSQVSSSGSNARKPEKSSKSKSSSSKARSSKESSSKEESKDIFALLVELTASSTSQQAVGPKKAEATLIVVGDSQSGKSTVISAVRGEPDTTPASTSGLDYQHMTRKDKSVCSIWEVAGGPNACELMDVPLGAHTVNQAAIAIAIDLSKTDTVMPSLQFWTDRIKQRLQAIDSSGASGHSSQLSALKQECASRYKKAHADNLDENKRVGKGAIDHIGVPVVVVGTHFDLIADKDTSFLRGFNQCLRAFCHLNGMSLCFLARVPQDNRAGWDKMTEDARTRTADVLLRSAFHVAPDLKNAELSVASLLHVPAGADTFADIGLPELVAPGSTGQIREAKVLEKCKPITGWNSNAYTSVSAAADAPQATMIDPEGNFKEDSVDAAVVSKERELSEQVKSLQATA